MLSYRILMAGPFLKSFRSVIFCKFQLKFIATDTKLFWIIFLSLGWQEIKIAMQEKELVLCAALNAGSHCRQTKSANGETC